MNDYIKSVFATGIYGRFHIPRIEFQSGVNIIHGGNGTGKTTLLHILSNALTADYRRFAHLNFSSIQVELGSGKVIRLNRNKRPEESIVATVDDTEVDRFNPEQVRLEEHSDSEDRARRNASMHNVSVQDEPSSYRERLASRLLAESPENLRPESNTPHLEVSYFPAFRTMLEALVANREGIVRPSLIRADRWKGAATLRARQWFGDFVPTVNFPSLSEIQDRITGQVEDARAKVWRTDRTLLTKAFAEILRALNSTDVTNESAREILDQVRILFDRLEATPLKSESTILTSIRDDLKNIGGLQKVDDSATRVLHVYREMLRGIVSVQESSFAEIQTYLDSVNQFLRETKSLFVNTDPGRRGGALGIRFLDNSQTVGIGALSSGERQIATMIYATTHMGKQKVVLIDEPEISLHIDWQAKLLRTMSAHLGDRQLIVCTHSPVIGEDYEERMQKLTLIAPHVLVDDSPTLMDSESGIVDEDYRK